MTKTLSTPLKSIQLFQTFLCNSQNYHLRCCGWPNDTVAQGRRPGHRNTHLLPPKPKSSFRHLKRGIQDFHMNYVLVPADKAANNVVVVWRLYYINTLKRELVDTNAYKLQPSLSERVIVDGHGCHTALHFGVKAKENQDKVPTLYWLPKLHKKNPIKQDLLQILVLVRQQNFLNC